MVHHIRITVRVQVVHALVVRAQVVVRAQAVRTRVVVRTQAAHVQVARTRVVHVPDASPITAINHPSPPRVGREIIDQDDLEIRDNAIIYQSNFNLNYDWDYCS